MTQMVARSLRTHAMVKIAVATILLCVLVDEFMSAAPGELPAAPATMAQHR